MTYTITHRNFGNDVITTTVDDTATARLIARAIVESFGPFDCLLVIRPALPPA